jgi:hypothetical protein
MKAWLIKRNTTTPPELFPELPLEIWCHIYLFLDDANQRKLITTTTVFYSTYLTDQKARNKTDLATDFPIEYYKATRQNSDLDYKILLQQAKANDWSELGPGLKTFFHLMLGRDYGKIKAHFESYNTFVGMWLAPEMLPFELRATSVYHDKQGRSVLFYWRAAREQNLLNLVYRFYTELSEKKQPQDAINFAIQCLQPRETLTELCTKEYLVNHFTWLLKEAVKCDHMEAIQLIVATKPIDFRELFISLLKSAAENGSAKAIQWLLDQNVSLENDTLEKRLKYPYVKIDNADPLFLAAHHGHVKIALLLLDKGAKVNQKYHLSEYSTESKYSCSLLYYLMRMPCYANEVLVKGLLARGADVNASANGESVLSNPVSKN